MPTWTATPMRTSFQSMFGQNPQPTATTSYQIPFTNTGKTYMSSGSTFAPQSASSTYRSSALGTLGSLGTGGGATSMQPQRPAYQPSTAAPGGSSAPSGTSTRSGLLSQPGAYEQWYQQNASRYNAPTALSSYYQGVAGKFGGQRYQPTTSRDAYGQVQSMFSQPSQGATNARSVADQLRQQSAGEDAMNTALGYFGGVNNAEQYYGDNRAFYGSEGDIENYYDQNADRFQQAGFGENYAQGVLGNQALTGMFDNRLVGDELDFFRDPLRNQSYSEQLYESGNQGLNTYYDRERARQQEDLENQMSAMGVFGSGETVQGMTDLRSNLAAEQSRDMAGLAGQADAERRARADLLFGAAGSAAEEEMARGGLMLDAAGTGMQLDRDAIARLTAGGNLANQSSAYALNRVNSGMNAANTADASRFAQGAGMAGIGTQMSQAELNRLNSSSAAGLAADTEERQRMMDMFNASMGVDNLGLNAQAADLSWINAGGQMANQVDAGNLGWLNAGGDAASLAQNMFQDRERYGFTDPLSLGQAMGGTYGQIAGANTAATQQQRTDAINLLVSKYGMRADEADAQVDRLWSVLNLGGQIAGGR